MSIAGKKAAKALRKEFKLLSPSLEELKDIIQSHGYTLIEFNGVYNEGDVALMIETLHLEALVSERKGFIYADKNNRFLFLEEELSEEEKRNVLLHETGHILCGHVEENTYLGRDVQQEVEANEFAYCMKHPAVYDKILYFFKKNKIWLSIALAALIIGLILFGWMGREKAFYGDYVVTETGNKYHQRDCIHVKNKTNTQRLTMDQFKSGEYNPCGICLPKG